MENRKLRRKPTHRLGKLIGQLKWFNWTKKKSPCPSNCKVLVGFLVYIESKLKVSLRVARVRLRIWWKSKCKRKVPSCACRVQFWWRHRLKGKKLLSGQLCCSCSRRVCHAIWPSLRSSPCQCRPQLGDLLTIPLVHVTINLNWNEVNNSCTKIIGRRTFYSGRFAYIITIHLLFTSCLCLIDLPEQVRKFIYKSTTNVLINITHVPKYIYILIF